jgi:NADH-quinone oxidoreductase subunit J
VVVYIGAIAILIIFAVMLTRRVMIDTGPTHNRTWWVALLSAVILLGGLLALIWQLPAFQAVPANLGATDTSLADLGTSLVDVNRYLLPFEVASVLLLAALIGAIAVARPVGKGEEADE